MNRTQFFQDQLNKPTEDSKKWKMAIIGLKGLGVGFFAGIIMIALFPAQAAHVTTMVQIGMTAWGGIVGIYLGAQGTVEYKATSALQTTIQQTEEHKEEHIVTEGKPGDIKPWSPAAKSE